MPARKPPGPFRRLNSSPEVIRFVVMIYVRYPLSLRNVKDLRPVETSRRWSDRAVMRLLGPPRAFA